MKSRASLLSLPIVALGLALPSTALADANANSHAGICGGMLVKVSCTTSESQTDDSGSQSSSSATPVAVLGVPVNEKTCEASSDGTQSDSQPSSGLEDSPLLNAACDAVASQDSASSSGESSLFSASEPDLGSLELGASRSETSTTQDSFSQSSEFTLVRITNGENEFAVLACRQQSSSATGGEQERDDKLLILNDQSIDDPILCRGLTV